MEYIKGIFVTLQAYRRGQTMTEYALILAAVAVVVFAGYQLLGTDINGLLGTVDSQL
jgi:Flp pilus assembly pilin Flp